MKDAHDALAELLDATGEVEALDGEEDLDTQDAAWERLAVARGVAEGILAERRVQLDRAKTFWACTHAGRVFRPAAPTVEMIDIQDIAVALSRVCRFGGHCSRFYSVAEHSYWAAVEAERRQPNAPWLWLAALLHDATEAYLGDVVAPLKWQLHEYRIIEERLAGVMEIKFGLALSPTGRTFIRDLDLAMLATERRDLMPATAEEWNLTATPIPDLDLRATTWSPTEMAETFLRAFHRLESLVSRGAR